MLDLAFLIISYLEHGPVCAVNSVSFRLGAQRIHATPRLVSKLTSHAVMLHRTGLRCGRRRQGLHALGHGHGLLALRSVRHAARSDLEAGTPPWICIVLAPQQLWNSSLKIGQLATCGAGIGICSGCRKDLELCSSPSPSLPDGCNLVRFCADPSNEHV